MWPVQSTVSLVLALMTLGTVINAAQALCLSPQLFTSIISLMIYSTGVGMVMPAMAVLALDCFPRNRGAASVVPGSTQTMGNALIASLAVPFLGHRPDWMALGQLLLIVMTLLLWRFLPAQS